MDPLSRDTLMGILHAEFESDETDVELIRRVSKALDKKDGSEDVDVDAAWERFLKLSSESEPIYDLEENGAAEISEARAKKRRPRRKAFFAVAAVIAILIGCTVVANANGMDLWGAVASWTAETFGFSQKNEAEPAVHEIPEQLKELADYFDRYAISRDKLPTYIPDGYVHKETKIAETSTSNVFSSLLSDGDNNIIIQYRLHKDSKSFTETQKDITAPQVYKLNGIDFYIATNDNLYFAVWLDGNLECLIGGVNSRDELIKMINSIYKDA